jgi:DNA-binding response OmpR family regulator
MKRVMIVDDNEDVLELVSELVASSGYQPVTATGGKECLDSVEEEQPDLILLDINMPDIDGWTVLRKLKEKGLTDEIKVMMLTATTDVGTDIFGLQDVVAGYIRKPFSNRELSDRLKGALEEAVEQPEVVMVEESKPGFISRMFGKSKANAETPSGKERMDSSAMKYTVRRGFGYIVKEKKPVRSFQVFVDQVTHDIQGLCVTRQHPGTIRSRWGLEKTPIIWLSNKVGKVYVNPTNIGILSDTIIRFVEKSGESIVLIDGLEFLIVNNDFEKVLRMIHHISEAVMEYKSRLLISVDPRILETREMALLERNMEMIDTRDYIVQREDLSELGQD